jgi:hypothetical protein
VSWPPTGFEFEVFVVAKDEWADLNPFGYGHDAQAEQSPPGRK